MPLRARAFAAWCCAYSTVKNAEKIVEEKINKTRTGFFFILQVTAITRCFHPLSAHTWVVGAYTFVLPLPPLYLCFSLSWRLSYELHWRADENNDKIKKCLIKIIHLRTLFPFSEEHTGAPPCPVTNLRRHPARHQDDAARLRSIKINELSPVRT